ncbi:MAG: hypothetical protein IJJ99_04975 [Oscillospiraceae bacterium]|nr:hypothetical protein [Oscillospiraceae bacterium]
MRKYYLTELGTDKDGIVINLWKKNEISEEEFYQFFNWFRFTGYYSRCKIIKAMVDESANDFINYYSILNDLLKKQKGFQSDPYLITGNKLLIAYLSFITVFIDVVKNEISKHQKDDLASFQKLDSELYDELFGYRLCKRMRNYVTHFGMPLTIFNQSMESGVSMLCVKDELLRFEGWSKLKDEIMTLPDNFDFRPYIRESQAAIQTLFLHALEFVFNDALKGYENYQRLCKEQELKEPVIVTFDNENDAAKEMHPFPIDVMIQYFTALNEHPGYNISVNNGEQRD